MKKPRWDQTEWDGMGQVTTFQNRDWEKVRLIFLIHPDIFQSFSASIFGKFFFDFWLHVLCILANVPRSFRRRNLHDLPMRFVCTFFSCLPDFGPISISPLLAVERVGVFLFPPTVLLFENCPAEWCVKLSRRIN